MHLVRRQVLQRVWERAQQRARVYQVRRKPQQPVWARSQALRTVEEGQEAARRQQASQDGETATLQGEDSDPEATLHRLRRQVLQKVGSRTRTVQAAEAHRAWAHNVQEQIRQYAKVMAQGQQAAKEEGSQMGDLLSTQGNEPEAEQSAGGLSAEALLRWLNLAQGEGTVASAAQQAVVHGMGTKHLVECPVMHLVESTEGLDELLNRTEGLEKLPGRIRASQMRIAHQQCGRSSSVEEGS